MTWMNAALFLLAWTLFAFAAGPLVGRYLLRQRPLFVRDLLDETAGPGSSSPL